MTFHYTQQWQVTVQSINIQILKVPMWTLPHEALVKPFACVDLLIVIMTCSCQNSKCCLNHLLCLWLCPQNESHFEINDGSDMNGLPDIVWGCWCTNKHKHLIALLARCLVGSLYWLWRCILNNLEVIFLFNYLSLYYVDWWWLSFSAIKCGKHIAAVDIMSSVIRKALSKE